MITIFETGATSHTVNDLILFAENTRELVELRDKIYMRAFNREDIVCSKFRVIGLSAGWNALKSAFSELLRAAVSQYCKEMPTSCRHIQGIKHWDEHGQEFCQLYVKGLNDWAIEHKIEPYSE